MPAKSKAQLEWAKSEEGRKALGEEGAREMIESSQGLNLPDRVQRAEKLRHEGVTPKARVRLNLKGKPNWMKG